MVHLISILTLAIKKTEDSLTRTPSIHIAYIHCIYTEDLVKTHDGHMLAASVIFGPFLKEIYKSTFLFLFVFCFVVFIIRVLSHGDRSVLKHLMKTRAYA